MTQDVRVIGLSGSGLALVVVAVLMASCGHLAGLRDDVRAIRAALVADTAELRARAGEG
jgi:hypothetical protein